jgi:hypothetical protein
MQKRYSLTRQCRTAVSPCVTASGRSTGRAAAVVIGVSVLLLGPGRVQAQVIIDQQNAVGGSTSFGSTGAGQSFTPSLAGISFATFSLSTPNITDTLQVDLFNGSGYGGTLLASSAPVTVNTGATLQSIEFDFSSTVSLTPGNIYTARIVLSSGTTYGQQFSPSNPYTEGVAFGSNGVPAPTNDLVFSEGLTVVPEPSALALSALCGIGLAGRRKVVRNLLWPPNGFLTLLLPLMALGLLLAFASPARAQFVSQVLGDNPKGFWILNDAPGSPATAVDSSVNSFNGTYGPGVTPQGVSGPSWVPAPGLVANFTGGTVSFATPLNLGANGYTLEAWVNPSLASLTQTTRIVASGSGLNGYGFGTASGGRLVFTTFAQHDYFTTGVTLLPNQWQYVGIVLDASNDANFYVNGAFLQTVAGTLPTNPPTPDFTFGNQSPGPGHTDEIYQGGLAGVSVYDTPLTASQIQAQYNAASVPEPSSLMLTGLAAIGAGRALWQRRRKARITRP